VFAQIVGGTLRTLQVVPDGPVEEPKGKAGQRRVPQQFIEVPDVPPEAPPEAPAEPPRNPVIANRTLP
jgi:hypothetical protein